MSSPARRLRTASQITAAEKAKELQELMEEAEKAPGSPGAQDEVVLVVPSELHVYCKSMLGIDVTFIVNEDEITGTAEKELPETVLSLIKNSMLKKAGAQDDAPFLGESDPWCNLVRSLSIEATGAISKFHLNNFPSSFCALKNLQCLHISNHAFSTLPQNIAQLEKLQELTIEKTKLKSASELGNGCHALTHLFLNDNKITSVSRSFQNFKQLLTLDMRNNQIKDIYSEIASLQLLEHFNLSDNRISKLNPDLKVLTNLQFLDVSKNTLGGGIRNRNPLAPISSMTGLVELNVSCNKLSAIPSLDLLSNLKNLNVSSNLLSEFPVLYRSNALVNLDVSDNQITTIPIAGFTGLESLESLNLSKNKCKFIPSSIEALVNLTNVNISFNRISTIPDALGKLPKLIELNISNNDLMVVQNGIFCDLQDLKTLILKNNRLSRLPEDFFAMPGIQDIDLSGNTLQDLPKVTIGDPCSTLTSISLFNNQLSTLPEYFAHFPLQKIQLHENPITTLPSEFREIKTLESISIFNIIINSANKTISVIQNQSLIKKKEDDPTALAAIEHLLILSRNCPHRIFIFGLAELANDSRYQNILESHLDVFMFLLSNVDSTVAIYAIRALGNLALITKSRIVMYETPLLLQTLLCLGNRDDDDKLPLASQALKAIAHMCLFNKVAEEILKQGIDSFIEREASHRDETIREGCRKVLGNVGYIGHLNKRLTHLSEKRGVRILCMDGGGTKSVSTVMILQDIERRTGKKINELFDLICGTSVGGILSCLLGIACLDAPEVQILQKRFFREIFTSGAKKSEGFAEKVALLSNLFSTGGRYNTPVFEKILRDIFGEESLIDSSSKTERTKVFVAAVHMDVYPPDPFLFRNYTYPPGVHSRYPGNCERKVWEGIRATSAAPSMFTECVYDGMRFSDGGMAVNNPTGLAYHEFLNIWGKDAKLDCIVSIGTGATEVKFQTKSIKDFVLSVVESATSVARVDDIMEDFLAPEVYYRFNVVSDAFDVILDETRDDKIFAMEEASRHYIEQNEKRLDTLATTLMSPGAQINN